MTKEIISVFQIIIGILLVLLIIIQQKGTGLGSAFGGGISFYQTRRGVEKILFYLTIFVATLFFVSTIIGLAL